MWEKILSRNSGILALVIFFVIFFSLPSPEVLQHRGETSEERVLTGGG